MRSNLTLIGMPGAGKSTVGVILAKYLSLGFVDTDILIQTNCRQKLQDIMDQGGPAAFREIEENQVLKLNVTDHVIATGGSVVYSERAMGHLKAISWVVFLDVKLQALEQRIDNFETRGIARQKDQTLAQVLAERQPLYRRHADYSLDCNRISQEKAAIIISNIWRNSIDSGKDP